MSLDLTNDTGTCAFCGRGEIEIVKRIDYVEVPSAPAIGLSVQRMCEDCWSITFFATRVGSLALRNELTRIRQLDLFEAPKERVLRKLKVLEGTDAPSPS